MPTQRFDPAATPFPEAEAKYVLARGVIGALDRAFRTRRMYQPDHPLYIENTEEVLSRVVGFFENHSYLRLEVAPEELRIDGKMVLQAPARDPELPFRLYKDGIRELRFHRGLSREELLDFISIMELGAEELEAQGEDYVSLLWSKDFRAIDYVAVDEFEVAAGETPAGMYPQMLAKAQELARRIDQGVAGLGARNLAECLKLVGAERRVVTLDEESLAFPDTTLGFEDDTGVLSAIRPLALDPEPPEEPREGPALSEAQIDAFLLRDLKEHLAAMRSEVENENVGGTIRRSLGILLALEGADPSKPIVEAAPLLRGVTDFYLRKGDFASIGHLLSHIEYAGYVDHWPGGRALWDLLVEAVRKPEVQKPMLAFLNRMTDADADGLRRYFKIVGPTLVRAACRILPFVYNARGREALRDYLIAFGHAEPEAFRELMKSAERNLADVYEIVRQVKPPGIRIDLEAYLRDPRPELRRQAISAAARNEGPLRMRQLLGAVKDPDPAVRAHACRTIGETKDPALRLALQDWMESVEFAAQSVADKENAVRAYIQVGGSAAPAFLKILATRVAKGRGAEVRRAAVLGLRDVGTAEALEFLRGAARGADEELARLAREALEGAPAKGERP